MTRTKFRLAVVGIVSAGRDKVLLVQKKHSPAKELAGHWVFPGGDIRGMEGIGGALQNILRHDLQLEVVIGEIIDIGTRQRETGGSTEFICTIWLQAQPLKSSNFTLKSKWLEAKWFDRREVLEELSDAVKRWLPDGVLEYLLPK